MHLLLAIEVIPTLRGFDTNYLPGEGVRLLHNEASALLIVNRELDEVGA